MAVGAAWTIGKPEVGEWISRLLGNAEVIAPAAAHGGDTIFRAVTAPAEVRWEDDNPLHPPKCVLLPQTDPLVEIAGNGNGVTVTPTADGRPRVLLGVRSCDVTGIGFLGRMHAAEPPDGAYLRRAERVSVVSVACARPCGLGFCICCDAGPFLKQGFDVQLTDLGDRFLAETGSNKGERLVAPSADLFRPATDSEVARRAGIEEAARGAFGPESCHFASAMRRLSTGRIGAALWEEIAAWCLECGACTFVCPTCYCFSVKDQRREGNWLRCRTWDSCQFRAFTLEASGHNPREAHRERVKRRFFHKVSAQYFRRDGAVGCVGCGRCIKVCLGTADMPAVVAAIRKGAWHG